MGVLGESPSELSRELVDGVAKLRLSSLVLEGEPFLPENLLFLEGDVKADLDGWFFVVPGVDTDLEEDPDGKVMGEGFFPFMVRVSLFREGQARPVTDFRIFDGCGS